MPVIPLRRPTPKWVWFTLVFILGLTVGAGGYAAIVAGKRPAAQTGKTVPVSSQMGAATSSPASPLASALYDKLLKIDAEFWNSSLADILENDLVEAEVLAKKLTTNTKEIRNLELAEAVYEFQEANNSRIRDRTRIHVNNFNDPLQERLDLLKYTPSREVSESIADAESKMRAFAGDKN